MIPPRQLLLGAAHRVSQSSRTLLSCRGFSTERVAKVNRWTDAETWGFASAAAGWTMSLAAIYDSLNTGPEVISLSMTGVLILYSSLFCRWAYVVRPQNLFLAACHVTNVAAQLNQGRRAVEYQLANGQEKQIHALAQQAGAVGAILGGSILAGPHMRAACLQIPMLNNIAKSEAGPFRVHFWAPMSKWLISGASLMDLQRPTEKISLSQFSSLTLCGVIHSRYALLVIPTNYMLFSVNMALLGSSGWHLGRKLKADFM
jgi:hypothetical protein